MALLFSQKGGRNINPFIPSKKIKKSIICIFTILACILLSTVIIINPKYINKIETFLSELPQLETIESILMPHSNVLNEKKAEFPLIDIDDVNLIWVGDSRTVGMKAHLQNDDTYICKSSMGLSWLQDTAIHTLKEKVQDNSIIIFNLGINDLYKLNQYVEYYNKIPEMFPNNMIVFMSVNPIDESQFEYIKNSKVKEFNETLEASFTDIVYIDTCTYLLENGFESFDGVHYGPSTSKDIRDFVINNLENMTIFRKKS